MHTTRLPARSRLAVLVIASALALTWQIARPADARAAAAAPSFASGWKQPPADAVLSGVSCPDGTFCVAAGSWTDALGGKRSAIQVWNGRRWTVTGGVPGVGLSAVSCPSRSFCMAVGAVSGSTGAVSWTGHGWRALPMPHGISGDALSGISCTGPAFCMAVGTDSGQTANVTLAWNGVRWRALGTPDHGCVPYCWLASVACPTRTVCDAVGGTGSNSGLSDFTQAIAWNGRSWRETSPPAPDVSSALAGISCPSAADCVAVGNYSSETPACACVLAARWNGTTWTQIATPPASGGLTGVSCRAAGHCVAVGGPLAMTWKGGVWTRRVTVSPQVEGGIRLLGVSCPVVGGCLGVGAVNDAPGAQYNLSERWNGATWVVERTFSQGDPFSGLSGVSCPFSFACVAVGTYLTAADGFGALAERWDGHRWSLMFARSPGTDVSVLSAVSCPNAHDCMAVGYYDAGPSPQALAEQWDGTSWQVRPAGHAGELDAVSCTAPLGTCLAVGSYVGAGGHRFALTESWNGTTWQVQSAPDPGATITQLSGVWCSSATDCAAAGDYNPSLTGAPVPLTERWDGTAWQVQANPGGPRQLAAVACPGPAHCVAAGSDLAVHGPHVPSGTVSMLRNGGTWTLSATPGPAGGLRARLNGVSCRTRGSCQAAGAYETASGDTRVLAVGKAGPRWRLEPAPAPSPAFDALNGVSCSGTVGSGASICFAVGVTGAQQTLALLWNGSTWRMTRTLNR